MAPSLILFLRRKGKNYDRSCLFAGDDPDLWTVCAKGPRLVRGITPNKKPHC